jgi:hypothetical protein
MAVVIGETVIPAVLPVVTVRLKLCARGPTAEVCAPLGLNHLVKAWALPLVVGIGEPESYALAVPSFLVDFEFC